MKKIGSYLTLVLLSCSAQASEGMPDKYFDAQVGCPAATEQILQVAQKQLDERYHGIRYYCAVKSSGYSWWDLIPNKSEYEVLAWFSCTYSGLEPGDLVKGIVSYTHEVSCERCNPGLRHTCVPSFVPEFP